MERKGIAMVGNILTDNVKKVISYPEKGMLATIIGETLGVGGSVPNSGIDLKKIDPSLRVCAFGKIGADEKGKFVLNEMKKFGMETNGVIVSETAPTSYSDVITVESTGERTFFHNRGANAEFSPNDVDLDKIDCKILHAGYLLLLDKFDEYVSNTTPMAEFLKKAQRKGIKTSIDVVSESNGNFHRVVTAALPYCNYVIINEVEAGEVAGISPRNSDGTLNDGNVKAAMEKLMSYGVKDKIVVHCPEKGFCLDADGNFTEVASIKLPKGFIKGSVGAGDAFCAGCLYGIYNDYSDKETLELANLVAINCLSAPDSVSGVTEIPKLKDVLK